MKTHNVVQGSHEWLELREGRLTASEAPVMMGASSKMTRDELLRAKVTYSEQEFSGFVLRLFDKGHAAEASARVILEAELGDELYPVTGTHEVQGLPLLASYDGLTIDDSTGYEHKLWNQDLAAAVRAGDLPPEYYWQLEHQLLVCASLEKIIFVCSDGTAKNRVTMEYRRVPGRAEALVRGWKQWQADAEGYIPINDAPVPTANVIKGGLPALNVQVRGEVTTSNLAEYKAGALAYIRSINRDLQTDQHFADAEAVVKWCEESEGKLELEKQKVLEQTADIKFTLDTLDEVRAELRRTRLDLKKLVDHRKEERKKELVLEAQQKIDAAIKEADAEFRDQGVRVLAEKVDLWLAIRNKRSIANMRAALDDAVARAKIDLTEIRDHIRQSLKIIAEHGTEYPGLFHDKQQLAGLSHDHLKLTVESRVQAEKQRQEAEVQRRAEELDHQRREQEERARAAQERQQQEPAAAAQLQLDAAAAPAEPRQETAAPPTQQRQEAPAQAAAQQQYAPPRATVTQILAPSREPQRPRDSEIIACLAMHWKVHPSVVLDWLREMDLETEGNRLANLGY